MLIIPGKQKGFGRALAEQFGTGLAGQLGSHIGAGIGQTINQGISSIGSGSRKRALVEKLIQSGMEPQQAALFVDLPPQAQQQMLKSQSQQEGMRSQAALMAQMLGATQGGQPQQGMGQPPQMDAQEIMSLAEKMSPGQFQNTLNFGQKQKEFGLKEKSIEQRERGMEQSDIARRQKHNQQYIRDMNHRYDSNRQAKNALDQMEILNEKGDLGTPSWNKLAEITGLNFGGIISPDSEQFKKLQGQFLPQMKSIFGARITDADLNRFMDSIPNLLQSKEGRSRIIKTLKNNIEADNIKHNVMRDLAKNQGSKLSWTLEDEVNDISENKLDELAHNFLVDMEKAIKEGNQQKKEKPSFKPYEKLETTAKKEEQLPQKIGKMTVGPKLPPKEEANSKIFVGKSTQQMPDASSFRENATIGNEHGDKWQNKNGKWVKIS